MSEDECPCPAEALLRQFYAFERRGRGWQLYDACVRPEPAFVPFFGHYLPASPPTDDGRQHTLVSSFLEQFRSLFKPKSSRTEQLQLPPSSEEELPERDTARDLVELEIQLPPETDSDISVFEQFLVGMAGCRRSVCFEIVGNGNRIAIHLGVDERDENLITGLLTGYFPDAVVQRKEDSLAELWRRNSPNSSLVVEFGLSRECMLPLATHKDLECDPYISFLAALSNLQRGEVGLVQVLFEPVRHPWSQSLLRSVTAPDGSPFFDDAPDFLKEAKRKISRPLFAVVIRIACGSSGEGRTWQIGRELASCFKVFANAQGNELLPLSNDGYDDDLHLEDLLHRSSRRSGILLNCEELASLVHLPGVEVQNPKLERLTCKTNASPASLRGQPLMLGTNIHNGKKVEVSIGVEERVRHMHVIGASGTGKSTFLLNLILQDIHQGHGVGVIDPHGDLIDQVIARIPESRIKDVVLVDPSDDGFPISFNILSAHSDLEKTLLASDLVAVFRRFSTSWGDQMGSVLSNAVLAFLESTQGGTLADLRRFLIEPAFRKQFLETVLDPHVTYYWSREFPLLSGRPQAPLLTRLDTFLRPKPVRYMVSQQENRLDIAHIMDSGKIFLAKLAQGAIGEENASLLGSLFVSKFHQLTLGRQSQSESSRRPFFLYCDEFGGYVTPSMSKLLSGARKFRLGLILSHQELRQLHDQDVETALISNAGTRICFRLGDSDAKTLSEGFSHFEANDLMNLATGEAICRVGRSTDDFNLTTAMTGGVDQRAAEARREAIIAWTRQTYGTPRAEIETKLNEAMDSTTKAAEGVTEVKPAPQVEQPKEVVTPANEIEEKPETPTPRVIPKILKPIAPVVSVQGKGGREHKYLQQMIAQWAQGMGYKATIEMPVGDGNESVDVVLEKDERKIACELSVTSTVEQELGNLRKCLAGGFTDVFMIGADARTLKALKKAAEGEMEESALKKVRFLSPDELMTTPELLETKSGKEQLVRGYKVKVKLRQVSDVEAEERRRAVSEVLVRGMRKSG